MKSLFSLMLCGLLVLPLMAQTPPEMLENALPSVVTVAVYKTQAAKQILGMRGDRISDIAYARALDLAGAKSSGSGFIIRKNNQLFVVTNAHVIDNASNEAGSIAVFTIDRKRYEVQVVGGDNFYDIAVLRFKTPPTDIHTLAFRASEPRIGETVYAIGNPLGDYPYTVTNGIISAKNRVREGTTGKFGFLQSTATVIWGNSGGPLVDAQGQVVGINTQTEFTTTPDGSAPVWQSQINFALEAKLADRLVTEILTNNGRIRRAFLGIELSQRAELVRREEGFRPVTVDSLPVLSAVLNNTEAAGVLAPWVGAQVLKINNEPVRNLDEALGELEKQKMGQPVSLLLLKDNKRQTVTFRTRGLDDKALESIAAHAIEQRLTTLSWNRSAPRPSFSIRGKGVYEYSEQRKFNSMPSYNSSEQFQVVAGGVRGQRSGNFWQTNRLADVGAALRFSGTNGVFDMVVVNSTTEDRPQVLRVNLSGDESILQKTLWY